MGGLGEGILLVLHAFHFLFKLKLYLRVKERIPRYLDGVHHKLYFSGLASLLMDGLGVGIQLGLHAFWHPFRGGLLMLKERM